MVLYYTTLAFSFAWLIFSICIVYLFLRSIINGAIYFPTSRKNVETVVELAEIEPGGKAADLGSGDGRILIALAQAGAEAHGYEINPYLVYKSRRAIQRAGLGGRAFVYWKSFWRENFSPFQTVTLYGIPYIMRGLESKLQRELKPGARVVSNIFRFPTWQPKESKNQVHLYVQS